MRVCVSHMVFTKGWATCILSLWPWHVFDDQLLPAQNLMAIHPNIIERFQSGQSAGVSSIRLCHFFPLYIIPFHIFQMWFHKVSQTQLFISPAPQMLPYGAAKCADCLLYNLNFGQESSKAHLSGFWLPFVLLWSCEWNSICPLCNLIWTNVWFWLKGPCD